MTGRDTIYALSSGNPPSGVAIIRISGPRVRFAIETIFGHVPLPRRLHYGTLRDSHGTLLDRGMAVFFPGPQSYSGEDMAEFHVHGGHGVVAGLMAALAELPGLRQAEAGEFTRRAFLNGKIDLTEAEALADLIAAETAHQRNLALTNASGAQRVVYEGWRERIIRARAHVEAVLDFGEDEPDVPDEAVETAMADMERLAAEIDGHIAGYRRARMLREGVQIVILGAPNTGKSTLINALAEREVAIVSELPGTTRDLIDVALDLQGVKVILTDTAGLREHAEPIEKLGITRALARAEEADLVCLVEEARLEAPSVQLGATTPVIRVGTKADLLNPDEWEKAGARFDLVVSAHSGAGMDALVERLTQEAQHLAAGSGMVLPTRLRHIELLEACREALVAAGHEDRIGGLELLAERLREAGHHLGRVTGRIDVEDLLDRIFADFCIGK
jgi:tRNA modification GTPase